MTWTKTADDFPDRLLDLSDSAYRLHHAATTYANRVGLDGRIPKARLTLLPVPAKTRRASVVKELVSADLWAASGDAWELLDFFEAQLSSEEVRCRREYDAIRQRIRFASTPEIKAVLRQDEDAAKSDLNAARERRRARTSQRDSQRDSQSPVPFRPAPARPDPTQGRGRGRKSAPPVGAFEGATAALTDEEAALVDLYDRPPPKHLERPWCYDCDKPFIPPSDTRVNVEIMEVSGLPRVVPIHVSCKERRETCVGCNTRFIRPQDATEWRQVPFRPRPGEYHVRCLPPPSKPPATSPESIASVLSGFRSS